MVEAKGSTISIGGNVSGSVLVQGDFNDVKSGASVSDPIDQSVVVAQLESLRELVKAIPGPDSKRISNAVEEALDEAKQPEPRKDVVGEALERALKLSSSVAGFATQLDKLRPGLKLVSGWLGTGFSALVQLVGG